MVRGVVCIMLEINYDCFRDVLQYLIDNLGEIEGEEGYPIAKTISRTTLVNCPELSSKYSQELIRYTIKKLLESNYIEIDTIRKDSHNNITHLTICDVTMSGKEFLNLANKDDTWTYIKGGFKKFSGFSLEVIKTMLPHLAELYCKSL